MLGSLPRFIPGLLLLPLIACATPAPGIVTSVTIDGGDRSIVVGDSVALAATVAATGSAGTTVSWSSSNEAVATVDAIGRVTAHAIDATTIMATSTADPSRSGSIVVTVVPPGMLAWTRQFGSDGVDVAYGATTDPEGNVYAAGSTLGALEGPNAGSEDGFLRSYDRDGTVRWTRQFGTSASDLVNGIAADANGNLYAAGATNGSLEGANAGLEDAFLRSYDHEGALRWTRQFGTSERDIAYGVATDANGNVYAAGTTFGDLGGVNAGYGEGFVRSYDGNGTLRWTRQFGAGILVAANGVASDGDGNVYAAGFVFGALEGASAGLTDAFVRSYDANGALRWTRQFGTSSYDTATGIATDQSGNVYATGAIDGELDRMPASSGDAFVRSYDRDGALRWVREFGTADGDIAYAIATDAIGHVYAGGETGGALEGAGAGATDAFVRSYRSDGALRWTRQFGTSDYDPVYGVATDADGNIYAAGSTAGTLVGFSAGSVDAFVRRYGP